MPTAKVDRSSPRLRLLVVAQIFLLVGALFAPHTSLAAGPDPNGHIVVNKQTDPDGSPQSFHFTTTGAGYAAFNLTDGGTNDQALAPGTYTVEEDQVNDWDSSMSCHDQVPSPVSPNFIVLAAGKTITCDVVNTQRGHIIVHKTTIPSGSPQSFDFTTTPEYDYYAFSLADGETDDQLLLPGSYSVSEDPVADWTTTYECVDQDDGTVDPGAITLLAGGTVECTFTNTDTRVGSITIAKTAVGGDDATFHFTSADVPGAPFDVTTTAGSGATSAIVVSPGTYHVTESSLAGWAFTSLVCSDGSSTTAATATIDVSSGEDVTCTWTNTKPASLTVIKHVINDNGGEASAGDWNMDVTATNPSSTGFPGEESTGTLITINAGSYSVAESGGPSGYTPSSSAECSGTAVAGGTYTCTITNDDIAPSLTLVKTVTLDNGGLADPTEWTLTATGAGVTPTNLSGTTPVSSDATFKADTYTLAESGGPSGYTPGDWTCDNGVIVTSSQITLAPGQTTTCTIDNNDQPASLTVIKHVVNGSTGTAVAGDWNMDVTATNPSSTGFPGEESPGTPITIDAGTFSVDESGGPAGYTASSSGCSGTAVPGGTYTCTITNDQNPTVTINQAGGQVDPTNVATIHFTVQFSEPVTDFDDLTDVSLGGTATSAVTSITPLGGDAYDVLVTATTNGTVIAAVPAATAVDAALNPNIASTSTDNQVTYGTVATVVTLTTLNGSTVAFPYSTNVNVTSLGGSCGTAVGDSATVHIVITGTASQSGDTTCAAGSWTYTTSPALSADGSYLATATQSNSAGEPGTSGAKSIAIDETLPLVNITKVNKSAVSFPFFTSANLTRLDGTCGTAAGDNGTVNWSLVGPAPSVAVVRSGVATCSGGTWTSGKFTSVSAAGLYEATASQGDATGNTGTTTRDITIDKTKPTVTVSQAAGQLDPTKVSPVHFTIVFSEEVTGFVADDISFSGTASRGSVTITPIVANVSWDVTVPLTSDGTVIASVASGKATDLAGNSNKASTSTDNTITYDTTAPDTTIVTKPTNPSFDPNPIFTFTSSQTPATFECKLDSGSFATCLSGIQYPGLGFGSHTFSVRATDAVGNTDATPASYTWTIDPLSVECGLCILATTQTGLELNGNGAVTVTNGGVHVNSTDPQQAVKVGGHAELTAVYIGGPAAPAGFKQTASGIYSQAPVTLAAISDPLASLVQCSNAAGNLCASLTAKADVAVNQKAVQTIQPGIYNAIQATGNAKLTMAPGIYVIKGSLKVDKNASIIGNGVTLYLACSNYPSPCAAGSQGGVVELDGNGTMTLSAPTSGEFAKIAIFADRNNISTSKLGGNGSGFDGTIYMKSGRLQVTGVGQTLNGRIVVDTAIISGSGTLTINVP